MTVQKMPLAEVCRIDMGQAPDGESYNDAGAGVALIAGAGDFGDSIPKPKKFTTSATKLSQAGDIILCIRATIGDRNWSDREYCLGRGVAGLRADQRVMDQSYLWHWLGHAAPELRAKGRGATFLQVNKSDIGSMEIPLPSLVEQRRIAAILDKADALRVKRREVIAMLDRLLQSVFLDMFGDPIANPKGWCKVKMDRLMSITRGGSPRPIDKFLGGEHHWVKIGDATKGDDVYISDTKEKIISEGLCKTTHLKAGSLIFANCGVSLGFARILKVDGCIHDGWLAFGSIDPHQLDKLFLLKALNSITEYFRSLAPEGTQPNLNTGIMKAFELIVPPLEMQRKFAEIVESVRARKLLLLEAESYKEQLFSSLQKAAFTDARL